MSDGANHNIRFGRIAAMLPVKDIQRACDFYTKAFGFTKVFENGDPVGLMILKKGPSCTSRYSPITWPPRSTSRT
jgi:catechol 2,3-dioxygenase-like lactoylglutathione lyase family enzyme